MPQKAVETAPVAKTPVDLVIDNAGCYDVPEKEGAEAKKADCKLGKTITFWFHNLPEWSTDPLGKGNKPLNLVLILNGRQVKGIKPRYSFLHLDGQLDSDPSHPNQLQFDLQRLDLVQGDATSQDNRDAWSALMSRAKLRQAAMVGVALPDSPPSGFPNSIIFRVLPWWWGLALVAMLALLLFFVLMASNSDMLRDGPASGADTSPWWRISFKKKLPRNSYSLAKCQMAWWFFIVVASFIYIWMVVGDTDTLTPGALIMIGISAATGFSSFLVDASKESQRNALQVEGDGLQARLDAIQTLIDGYPPLAAGVPTPADLAALLAEQQQKGARLAEVIAQLASLPSPVGSSEGLFNDILRDETGVSFHRFQMAAWTVILGGVFVAAVYQKLAMPDFSATLLGLMGISAGTYVGFKIPNPTK